MDEGDNGCKKGAGGLDFKNNIMINSGLCGVD